MYVINSCFYREPQSGSVTNADEEGTPKDAADLDRYKLTDLSQMLCNAFETVLQTCY